MGVIEIYLAIGIVIAILLMVALFTDSFDEAFNEVSGGMVLSTGWKIYITLLTVLVWPYTVYRFFTLTRKGNED